MDKLFGARTKNDGAWHNYKTVSTFSSTCNASMSKLFNYLGLENFSMQQVLEARIMEE